jgi:hypothetical protein
MWPHIWPDIILRIIWQTNCRTTISVGTVVCTPQVNMNHSSGNEKLPRTDLYSNFQISIRWFTFGQSSRDNSSLHSSRQANESLLMISAHHCDAAVGSISNIKKKTLINLYYNETKCSVGTTDQTVTKYSKKRETRPFYCLTDNCSTKWSHSVAIQFPTLEQEEACHHPLYLLNLGYKSYSCDWETNQ